MKLADDLVKNHCGLASPAGRPKKLSPGKRATLSAFFLPRSRRGARSTRNKVNTRPPHPVPGAEDPAAVFPIRGVVRHGQKTSRLQEDARKRRARHGQPRA